MWRSVERVDGFSGSKVWCSVGRCEGVSARPWKEGAWRGLEERCGVALWQTNIGDCNPCSPSDRYTHVPFVPAMPSCHIHKKSFMLA